MSKRAQPARATHPVRRPIGTPPSEAWLRRTLAELRRATGDRAPEHDAWFTEGEVVPESRVEPESAAMLRPGHPSRRGPGDPRSRRDVSPWGAIR